MEIRKKRSRRPDEGAPRNATEPVASAESSFTALGFPRILVSSFQIGLILRSQRALSAPPSPDAYVRGWGRQGAARKISAQ